MADFGFSSGFAPFASRIAILFASTVQSLYNSFLYNIDLDVTWSCCGTKFFDHKILRSMGNDHKIVIFL